MIHLHRIHTYGSLALADHSKGFWEATKTFGVIFECSDGCRAYVAYPKWITDKRSGSSLADCVIPKWSDDDQYQAVIICHDMSYSGSVSKAIADELFYQGLRLCGYSKIRAGMAFQAVDKFGDSGYYNLGDPMPKPYTHNRCYEGFRHFATMAEASAWVKCQVAFV